MDKTPSLFTPIATTKELEDRTSWVNTSYQWNQEWQDNICQRLGEAVVSWALIESRLSQLYHHAITPDDLRSATWAWQSIHSAGALVDMADSALRGMENNTIDEKEWRTLLKKVKRQVTKRNRIAHCQIFYDHSARSESKKMFVTSPYQAEGVNRRFYSSDLDAMRARFQETAEELFSFLQKTFT